MAYRTPTSRKSKRKQEGINLIPILDAVFIFIFFLLMSTQFIKIFEIGSDVPIVSANDNPDKNAFGLTLIIKKNNMQIVQTKGSQTVKNVQVRNIEGEYDLETLHTELVKIKRSHTKEQMIIFEPIADLSYEQIVNIMDAVRKMKNTDDALFRKDKAGLDIQIKALFDKIIFGNIMS